LIKGVIVCAIGIVIIYYSLVGSSPFIAISALIVILVADWCVARHLAVLYLGIVTDSGKDALFFPYDMQSYTVIDYITLRFFKDYCNVDSVPLSAITKISRGRGKDLYVHGTFGSRSIVMSNKQKRDECLAMIQSVTGKKRLLIAELEGF
jgi:hypothetical protein